MKAITRINHKIALPLINPIQTAWDMNKDSIMSVIEAMSGVQAKYVDLSGKTQELPNNESIYGDPISALNEFKLFSFEWANALASVKGIRTTSMLCRNGVKDRPTDITISSDNIGSVTIHTDPRGHEWYEVKFEDKSILIDIQRTAEQYRVDMVTAMRICGQWDDHYCDLIQLPNGMYIPVDVLIKRYGIRKLTLDMVPLGKPRNAKTFSCPLCKKKSYYAGICNVCRQKASVAQIATYDAEKRAEKESKHREAVLLARSNDLTQCRYIRG